MIKFDNISIKLSNNQPLNYTVIFVKELFNPVSSNSLKDYCQNKKLFIVIDKHVYKLYGETIKNYFQKVSNIYTFYILDANEKNKNMKTVLDICRSAQDFQMKRDSIFIGIGGGITLDILGFAAFIFRRKTNYIRIPTTLVGLVDAGVGIKVGINFNIAKNLLGGYYPPVATFNDQAFLKTLDLQNIRNGLYEIVKIALIRNKALFELIEEHYKSFLSKDFNASTDEIIYTSALSMIEELDPNLHEENLMRPVDFGHTFSTYIEESSNYSINHGEAVGLDILISSFIALKRGEFPEEEFNRVLKLISSIGFTRKYKLSSIELFHVSLDRVRNHRAGNLNLVLPSKIGSCIFTNDCDISELSAAVAFCKDFIY